MFELARVTQVADSEYTFLLSTELISHRDFALDRYDLPKTYHLVEANGHTYYLLPSGSSILSIPFVLVFEAAGISVLSPDGSYDLESEVEMQRHIAALLMATLAAIFFLTARTLLTPATSAIVALVGAFGTQVFSTASRALWSDTWGILLLGIVLLLLLRWETAGNRLRPVLLATLLVTMYWVRPTFSIAIAAITILAFVFYRRQFLAYAITGAIGLISFVGYSFVTFGDYLPPYYKAERLLGGSFWVALPGNLVSPARGLLVFVPALVFVAYLLIRYRRYLSSKRLTVAGCVVIVLHILTVSCFPHWWGGSSFGPRFSTGVVPWMLLLGVLGVDAWFKARADKSSSTRFATQWQVEAAVGLLLSIASMFINTTGAMQPVTWRWNQEPNNIDQHPERLWDWRRPQFLAKYLPPPPEK